MSKPNKQELEALKQALDYDWPEIQRALIGDGKGLDSWWLDRFDRKDVLLALPGIVIMNTQPWQAGAASISQRAAYGIRHDEDSDDCFTSEHICAHIERFPEGQFAAMRISGLIAGMAVGMAATMRTSRPPTAPVLPWMDAIGDLRISAHEPAGDWLYGVEMAVHPDYRRHGIGTGLYEARFQLVKSLNLRGFYAVGMLMGYQNHADEMDVLTYGRKVIARELDDPTVTMQMNRGFRAEAVVTDYLDEPAAGDAGVLIVWDNPKYEEG